MNPVPILPLRLDWPSTVGHFILQFAFLEHQVFAFGSDWIPNKNIKNKSLNECVKVIGRHVEQNHPAQHPKFQNWKDRLEKVRLLRNHIAHGHFHLTKKDGEWRLTLATSRDADVPDTPRRVEHGEILKALEAVVELIEEFNSFGNRSG